MGKHKPAKYLVVRSNTRVLALWEALVAAMYRRIGKLGSHMLLYEGDIIPEATDHPSC